MAKTKSIRVGVKITPKIRDTFYSFSYEEEVEIDEHDDVEEVRYNMWDKAYNEVANQINETIKNS